MTAEIPSHEITLALRRREQERERERCVLDRGDCGLCWPCRRDAAAREREERRRAFAARVRTMLVGRRTSD